MEPCSASTLRRTTSMPTPRPETSVTSRAVEKPGARIREKISASESRAAPSISPCSSARVRTASTSSPRPSSLHPDQNVGARVQRRKLNGGARRFARRLASLGRLDAMIHAVADQMHQRIVQLVDHGFIELGVGALDGQLHVLLELDSQIVHQPAKTLEGGPERQHADAHGVLAQLAPSAAPRPRRFPAISGSSRRADGLAQAGLHGDQFADHVDQLVQLVGRNANGGGARPALRGPAPPPRSLLGGSAGL